MKNNSFELALNKLLILYIIDNFNHKLKENDLSYFILNNELFNYFYFKQYVSEMESTGLILFDDDKNYYLSSDGKQTLNLFYENIPKENLDFLIPKIEEYRHELILKNSVKTKIQLENNIYYVYLNIKDGDVDVLDLKIEVSDEKMGQQISYNFKKQPQKFYQDILRILISKDSN
ncbi:hypothetical protein ABID14_001014 [Peptoniphilus olsenii]|uniref:DUF4364 domain-containing protein n=1 Tax=Peptoniphilus olsenii TaxID=411570 RepID=A0ABV2J9D3_9FIRM